MGTRADFYVGRGETAEWIGSIAMDGYPQGIPKDVKQAKNEATFRASAQTLINSAGHGTNVSDGWPWPWDDSRTTDYAYAFDDGAVCASCFGRAWFDPNLPEPDNDGPKTTIFPDMKDRKNVASGSRSGLIMFVAR